MILTRRQHKAENAPLRIYLGDVVHCRHDKIKHKLSYKALSFSIDIDRLQDMDQMSSLLSVDRFNLFSFHPRDHMESGHTDLRGYVEEVLKQAKINTLPDKIQLLAYPRFWDGLSIQSVCSTATPRRSFKRSCIRSETPLETCITTPSRSIHLKHKAFSQCSGTHAQKTSMSLRFWNSPATITS